MIYIERIQDQLRESARRNYDVVPAPPFTIFINPDNVSPYANYAIPDEPVGDAFGPALERLRAAFHSHDRAPRFEFLQDFAPDLGLALRQHGFVEERTQLMLCTPETYRPATDVPGLVVERVDYDAPLEIWQAAVTVGQRAFGMADAPLATELEAEQYRRRFQRVTTLIARLYHQVVAVGSLTPPHGGLTELAGIGTLEPFQRRGIGAAISAYATRLAFDQGLDAVFLTAADERAGRVYERVGFRAIGVALSYVERDVGASGES